MCGCVCVWGAGSGWELGSGDGVSKGTGPGLEHDPPSPVGTGPDRRFPGDPDLHLQSSTHLLHRQ